MQFQWKREWTVPSLIGLGSFLVGAGGGYILSEQIHKRKFQNHVVETEITLRSFVKTATDMLDDMRKRTVEHFEKVAEEMSYAVRPDQVFTEEEKEIISNLVDSNVTPSLAKQMVEESLPMRENEDIWDYTEEVKNRVPQHPYIIHVDEYVAEEADGYSHSTLTYYKGDNILCDEHDTPIYDFQKVVGELKFGHGSRDPSIVYVRNERLEAEYEILLEEGYFQTVVLGEEVEQKYENDDIKHSEEPRKFRSD